MYIITRVEIDRNGYVVAYRKRTNAVGEPIGKELKDSYHVADIVEHTKNSTQLLSTSSSSSSSAVLSLSESPPSTAEAISNSLICEIIGCNEDQYDVCEIGCHKMLCAKHIKLHGQERSCRITVNFYYYYLKIVFRYVFFCLL